MAKATILTVGYEIPGHSDCYLNFKSDRSLMDADIVVFQPTLKDFHQSTYYMGKRRISDDDSPEAVEHCKRWRQEISEALKAGKTVIVFLDTDEEVYVHMGKKEYSGTGRNSRVTHFVDSLNSYRSLPFDLGTVIPKGGTEIRVVTDLKQVAPYWTAFGSVSPYKVYLKDPRHTAILSAKAPEAIVGLIIKSGKGTALLVPPIEYDRDSFISEKKGKQYWNKQALAFGARLVNALVELDRAFRAEGQTTPAPEWVQETSFSIQSERTLEDSVLKKDQEIERLRAERDAIKAKAVEAGGLRDLLFETGKPLEKAILRALQAMGFKAEPFKADGSEFDAVFSAEEGRFIGEAEGKNDRAISIEKLDQLERNIREDFSRQEDGKGTYAKGVLFGNAYRLRAPAERTEFFTAKCLAAAVRGKVALVRTTDLFFIARYLENKTNPGYAAQCRKAILAADGTVVAFPEPPTD